MTIREIGHAEWNGIAEVLRAEGGQLPDPKMSTAIVAMDSRGLAGFWIVQPCWHAGPLWIREDRRGTGLWRELHESLDKLFERGAGSGYYSFSGKPRVEAIFQKLGYKDLGYKVWSKELI